jgi:hypothetical protein
MDAGQNSGLERIIIYTKKFSLTHGFPKDMTMPKSWVTNKQQNLQTLPNGFHLTKNFSSFIKILYADTSDLPFLNQVSDDLKIDSLS